MGDVIANQAKGAFAEWHRRVDGNDPAPSALILVLLKASGLEADSALKDYDTLAAVLAASNDEADFTNYSRITYTDTNVSAPTVDDTNDRVDCDAPDATWTAAGGTVDNNLGKAVLCYDANTGSGTDSDIIPIAFYDYVIPTNGGDLGLQWAAAGYARAQ